jgi:hypothetical protein
MKSSRICLCKTVDLSVKVLPSEFDYYASSLPYWNPHHIFEGTSCNHRVTIFVEGCRFLSGINRTDLDILFTSEIFAKCGDWHVIRSFVVDPNGQF